jgi:hypothetical protein
MSAEKETSRLVDIETLFQKFEELVDQASVITKDNAPIAKVPIQIRVHPH